MSMAIPKPPYPRAPITESVLHLSVDGVAAPKELQKLVKRLSRDYPQQENLTNINLTVNTTGGPAILEQRPQGYRIRSTDQADLMLVLPDGIAAARLAPYPGWEHLRERAHRSWEAWRRNIKFSGLKRIGIRYINRIDVPIRKAEIIDIESYLRFTPRAPDFSTKPLKGYVMQVTGPTELDHWSVSVTSTLMSPAPLIDHLSMVLDIDVFRTERIPGREADCGNASTGLGR